MQDIREDTIITQEQKELAILFRECTPLEIKKSERISKEELKIKEIHKNLYEQEKIFINKNEWNSVTALQPQGLITRLMDFQLIGVQWMMDRENSLINGGILADEMGMGKTLQMLGLILSGNMRESTLIVAPSIAINQWVTEINLHSYQINVLTYHGRNKKLENLEDKNKFNVYLTTYGTIESEFRRGNSLLHSIEFHRMVLDEAHYIKDVKTSTSRAVSAINCKKRWGLTGTPVQNRVSDLYSLVKYLKLDPHAYYFCKKCPCKSLTWLNNSTRRGFCSCGHFGALHFGWWNRKISNPIKEFGYTNKGKEIFDNLQNITSHIILRRTKVGIERELGLPSKVVTVIRNYFSEEELDFYTSLYTQSKRKFMGYACRGEIPNNYAHIFGLLQKMRLAVNHPYLSYNFNEEVENPICGYCNEQAEDPVMSKCKHIFCREEAFVFLEDTPLCPVCKTKITIDLNQSNQVTQKSFNFTESWVSSTKIECLIEQLTLLRGKNGLAKSIVFSQYVNFLEMLRWRLERAGFRCVKIYGSMPLAQRKAAIEHFNTNKEITVFLISLKAGGVALNLTEASNVFLMDLWWNPAVEEQAMDRIHRIGQHRPIKIHRIIIQDSIESKVLQLQIKKKALFASAVDNDRSALEKLTEEDLMFLFS